jgi:hypothetical protein
MTTTWTARRLARRWCLTCSVIGIAAARASAQPPVGGRPVVETAVPLAHVALSIGSRDGQILLEEALDKPNGDSWALVPEPGGRALRVENDRIVVYARAKSKAGDCPLRIEGAPVVIRNRIGLVNLKTSTQGFACSALLTVAEPQLIEAVRTNPYNLARRLSMASVDPALPGPRLPHVGCLREDQLVVDSAAIKRDSLVVALTITPRAKFSPCP